MKRALLIALVGGIVVGGANAATLSMFFPGGAEEWTLGPSETVAIEIFVTNMVAGDTLSGLYHENGSAPGLTQTDTSVPIANWNAGGEHGPLGPLNPGPGNQAAWAAVDPAQHSISGPQASVLVGYQIVQQNPDYMGQDFQIMFAPPGFPTQELLDSAGVPWTWSGGDDGGVGYYTYGKGACYVPGAKGSPAVEADPLIIHAVAGNGDTDGGGSNGNDNTNQNDNANDNVNDNDNASDDANANDNVSDEVDTDDDGVPDDEDDFPNDPAETADTDDDGIGNNEDPDDDNDGVPDDVDEDPLDATVGRTSDGGGGGAGTRQCGFGMLGFMVSSLTGLLLMQLYRRR